ncbi:MAG: hypothetical protein JNK46_02570 [Methylobacteriaceae bacterium]|nr:hypothetical protein [Methylobacteriaceae bacterium]
MQRAILAGLAVGAMICASGAARAQDCGGLQVTGTPMVTPVTYKVSGSVPRVGAGPALDNVARAVAAEGFSNIRVDRKLSSVDAMQEMSGSGRPQFVRFVVRKRGAGVQVDATFRVQAGQASPEQAVHDYLCRVIRGAAG